MSAREALRLGIARLAAAGVPGAATDARRLLAHALGWPPDRLAMEMPVALDPEAAARFDAALAARAARRPVSQITGERLFWGRRFAVTQDVLDPRPETETLVAAALEAPFATVLDLGTGSGCILLSLLGDRPEARGTGVDVSDAALAVAAANAAALGLAGRARLVRSDWFKAVEGRFDLVVANPPYIAADEIEALAPEVRLWEPRQALTPGGDGLDAYRAIAAQAACHLAPGGRLCLEIGPSQAGAVSALLSGAGLRPMPARPDLDGRDRVIVVASG